LTICNLRLTIDGWQFAIERLDRNTWITKVKLGGCMNEIIFKNRTKKLAIAILRLVDSLPRSIATDALARQIVRSGTSIGANYRAACRAKSTADMINKLKIVEEESDETAYWLEIMVEAGYLSEEKVSLIAKETNEILAMTVASIKTLRSRNRKS
jgi:four helix bundle protein